MPDTAGKTAKGASPAAFFVRNACAGRMASHHRVTMLVLPVAVEKRPVGARLARLFIPRDIVARVVGKAPRVTLVGESTVGLVGGCGRWGHGRRGTGNRFDRLAAVVPYAVLKSKERAPFTLSLVRNGCTRGGTRTLAIHPKTRNGTIVEIVFACLLREGLDAASFQWLPPGIRNSRESTVTVRNRKIAVDVDIFNQLMRMEHVSFRFLEGCRNLRDVPVPWRDQRQQPQEPGRRQQEPKNTEKKS